MKLKAYVCVYLVLRDGNKVLFSLRQNTGFRDGSWSLVAGHTEEGEGVVESMTREAFEEAGIVIKKEDLQVAHIMQRCEGRNNIDIFLTCEKYSGKIENMEPHKCGGLQFFDMKSLPCNTIEYVKTAISNIEQGVIFSELP